ncbi:murein hydrolase activator EnvC family protein [Ferrovum myxofaciens]|jgi:lipoprotein NlpD|uniref:M23 family metallopeptidase n=2 Tax=root TaxID=1 RepID=A0A8F3IJZ3_9PROT|nr:M23 family metallopeptidase [Ferrovum myxofaciens]MBW8029044.1 peptidoglycan DD-metalloendopeptidase family protein [Ferrovum sp.]KXW58207.1 murein hydrolase activator NlpD precursor [Ferrovum myxofaciens]MBU6995468.1 M23 family metallopeptidase [Ferrovum myxofaciens]NDU88387.1 M23 family metallopeptidase [Ferrovum sp.]QKE39248.1 MAG: M23 family metallopeptidase [Ferrovum myxofaciens]
MPLFNCNPRFFAQRGLGLLGVMVLFGLGGCATEVPAPIQESRSTGPVTTTPAEKSGTNVVVKPSGPAEKMAHSVTVDGTLWGWPLNQKGGTPNGMGIDISTHQSQPVLAAADGVVSYVGEGISSYGLMVILKHPNDYVSVYAHNGKVVVHQGQVVTRGQKIAETGVKGKKDKPWHFEIRHGGKPLNPLTFYAGKATDSKIPVR